MEKSSKTQRKLVIANFTNGNTVAAVVVNKGEALVPMFKDISNKIPLVIFCAIIVQIVLLAIISYAVFVGGLSLDFLQEDYKESCFKSTIPPTLFLALSGVISLWTWEINLARKAPHLNIEMSFHRILRLFFLFTVISIGLVSSVECTNLYILILETVTVFIFFVVESTYHAMLLIYIHEFSKFTREQRKKSVRFVRNKINNNNDTDSKEAVKINVEEYIELESV